VFFELEDVHHSAEPADIAEPTSYSNIVEKHWTTAQERS